LNTVTKKLEKNSNATIQQSGSYVLQFDISEAQFLQVAHILMPSIV